MNTIEALKASLETLGFPVGYGSFEEATDPPCIVLMDMGNDDLIADNEIFVSMKDINVELYFRYKDTQLENDLETKLKQLGFVHKSYGDTWIQSEEMYQRIYEIQLMGG